jgi:ubiquinone/menaquinone biosynthesis C-methylase UbiE
VTRLRIEELTLMADAFHAEHAGRLEDPERLKALPQAAVVETLRLDGAETVVDYGAGTGVYTVAVAQALPHGRIIAVEALAELADQLRERAQRTSTLERLEIVRTETNAVPAPEGVADRVLMVDVLHHLYDQPQALTEVVRLLRPGGLFVVLDWADRERPIGPPLDHVLGLPAVREIVHDMGLDLVEAHDQGDGLPYHLVVVAQKPAV